MAIQTPRPVFGRVEEKIRRRDFIPADEPLTDEEAESVYKFSVDHSLDLRPQFIPSDPETSPEPVVPTAPVGNPDDQMEDAAALAKKATAQAEREEASGQKRIERVNHLTGLNVGDTIAFIESKSQHERQLWLEAEKAGRGRKTVLGHFGF